MARALATVDAGAIAANVARLRAGLRPAPRLCAVVKADGYGHGAVRACPRCPDGGARLARRRRGARGAELRDGRARGPRCSSWAR